MALAFVMTVCLLIDTLADVPVRQRLAETGQSVFDQAGKPTARPTLRWLFQYVERIDLLHIAKPDGARATEIVRLDTLHRLVFHLLGPTDANCYVALHETAE